MAGKPRKTFRNIMLVVAVLAVVAGTWFILNIDRFKTDFVLKNAEFAQVRRGTLTIPITATGEVTAAKLVEIRSRATGQVVKVTVEEGDWVNKGDLLIQLDPYDEQRAHERALAEVTRAQAMLERAKVAHDQRKSDQPTLVAMAEADVDSARARFAQAKAEWDRIQGLHEKDLTQKIEDIRAESSYRDAKAALAMMEAKLQKTITSACEIEQLKQDIAQYESALTQAQAALSETERRLEETDIYSPIDGLVVRVAIRDGERTIGTDNSVAGLPPLMILADVSKLYVNAEVDEADIGRVRDLMGADTERQLASANEAAIPAQEGTPLEITVEAFRDEAFAGRISRIKPMPKKESAVTTYDVEIEVTDPHKDMLFLGMQAEVRFTAQTVENALLVPNECVRTEGDTIGVYVPDCENPDDQSQRLSAGSKFVAIRRGLTDGVDTEVAEGLSEGQWVFRHRKVRMGSE